MSASEIIAIAPLVIELGIFVTLVLILIVLVRGQRRAGPGTTAIVAPPQRLELEPGIDPRETLAAHLERVLVPEPGSPKAAPEMPNAPEPFAEPRPGPGLFRKLGWFLAGVALTLVIVYLIATQFFGTDRLLELWSSAG